VFVANENVGYRKEYIRKYSLRIENNALSFVRSLISTYCIEK